MTRVSDTRLKVALTATDTAATTGDVTVTSGGQTASCTDCLTPSPR